MKRPPKVRVLAALTPSEIGGSFRSINLESELKKYNEQDLLKYYLLQEEGSIEELSAAKNLSKYYLLKISKEQQFSNHDKALWTDRFTEASLEIYGEIDPALSKSIANQTLTELVTIKSDDQVVADGQQRLKNLLKDIDYPDSNNPFRSLISDKHRKLLAISLRENAMKEIVKVVSSLDAEPPYQPDFTRSVFIRIINRLSIDETLWSQWNVVNTPEKAIISVEPTEHEIDVPDGRRPIESRSELLRLASHEIGVHVRRAINGEKVRDYMLQIGLAGYDDFEEGLGMVVEYLISGEVPVKAMDYYVEVALALGVMTDKKMSRNDLIQFVIDRERVRAYLFNAKMTEEQLMSKARMNIDRVFRGGDAIQYKNQENVNDISQAVFTMGGSYLRGAMKALTFLSEKLNEGRSADAIFEYLLSGKFDPTVKTHREYVLRHNGLKL